MNYSEEFEALWNLYPKRAGGNPKRKAHMALQARIKQGYDYGDIMEGVKRYATYCKVMALIGSPFVQQTATFLGLNEAWEEDWDIPQKEVKETIDQKGKRLNMPARIGESMDDWQKRIAQAR